MPLSYRFGEFELDPADRQLRSGGKAVPLERRPMDLLVLLVETAYVRMDTLRNVFEHQPRRVGNATASRVFVSHLSLALDRAMASAR